MLKNEMTMLRPCSTRRTRSPLDDDVPSNAQKATVARVIVDQLATFGVEEAFGVSGGAIAVLFDALLQSPIRLRHCRHECGAAFAATEASLASGKPTVVFATTGPGLLGSLSGLHAACDEGAKVILLSGATNSAQRGRGPTQETTSRTMPLDYLYGQGALFDDAFRLEDPAELSGIARRLGNGLVGKGGYVAHIALPMELQARLCTSRALTLPVTLNPRVPEGIAQLCAQRLQKGEMAVWVGYGAREASSRLRELLARTNAMAFCSPRAKGIVSERDPSFLGVTGIGGHQDVLSYMKEQRPESLLVLGTRLGEPTSFWDPDLLPAQQIVHVDIDPSVPGTAYPEFNSLGVQADVSEFVESVLAHLDVTRVARPPTPRWRRPSPMVDTTNNRVRPQMLMRSLQEIVIDGSDATVSSECGNAFAWCNHHLLFEQPNRYRVSTSFGSMAHMTCGVVGTALATDRKAFAVVGDGSMLMLSEVSTAVTYEAKSAWVILNDSGYGMCRDGHRALGLRGEELGYPQRVDFVAWARSMGADGVRVENESDLDAALRMALDSSRPFVVDVVIDPDQVSPLAERFQSLKKQGSRGRVAGWDQAEGQS